MVGPSTPGPILEGPGADPPSPWLGSAPEATPGTRTRTCGRSGDAASRGSGEAPRRATSPRTLWPAGRYGWRVRRRPGRSCAGDPHTTWPRASPGATRSGVALGLFPAGPHPRPLPPRPWKGRVCGSCPEPGTGKRPGSSAELTTFGWTPLGHRSVQPDRPRHAGRGNHRDAARRRPRPTRHRHRRLPVVRWRRRGHGRGAPCCPVCQGSTAAGGQQAGPIAHAESAPGRPAVGSRRPDAVKRSTCRPHRPGSETRIRLRTHRQGNPRLQLPQDGRSLSWPWDMVRPGHGR